MTHHLERIAPTHVHAPGIAGGSGSMASSKEGAGDGVDDSFTFTVGKLDAGMAILIGERASLIEFPSLLLPTGTRSGSVVNIRVHRNTDEERKQREDFDTLQREILDTFGRLGPVAPALRLRNVTQTSVTLEWDRLQLATATLLSLDIYRNNQRLAPIPNPLHNTSTKLSGLEVAAEYSFHLVLKTTAGTYTSDIIRTKTHTMNDTSGISVCLGHIADPDVEQAIKEVIGKMGARWSEKIQIETSHFVCEDSRNRGEATKSGTMGAMFGKATQMHIPIVKPHWIFACFEQQKMVPISAYYLDQDPPNASTLRESVARALGRSSSVGAASAATPTLAQPAPSTAAEPTSPAGSDNPPPSVISKDSPLPTAEESSAFPTTTTSQGLPDGQTGGTHLTASNSGGNLRRPSEDEEMDEISLSGDGTPRADQEKGLGGAVVPVDEEEHEEIDLS